jgi:hypothetical protein
MRSDRYRAGCGEVFNSRDGAESTRSHSPSAGYFKAATTASDSANYINFIGATVTLHADFGAGTFHNQTIGIPYQVVAGTQAKVAVALGAFSDESDPGPEPIPADALIEGYPKPGNGVRHVLVLEKDWVLAL